MSKVFPEWGVFDMRKGEYLLGKVAGYSVQEPGGGAVLVHAGQTFTEEMLYAIKASGLLNNVFLREVDNTARKK